jgi:hypothetical protein
LRKEELMAQIDYDIAMERCADFLARMIEKYGDKLLKEIEMENRRKNPRDRS